MAAGIKAKVSEIDGSHVVMLSKPEARCRRHPRRCGFREVMESRSCASMPCCQSLNSVSPSRGETPRCRTSRVSWRRPGTTCWLCDGAGFALGVITRADIVRQLSVARDLSASAETLMTTSVVGCRVADDLISTWQISKSEQRLAVPLATNWNRLS